MEGDGKSRWIGIATKSFQSTPSAWRETLSSNTLSHHLRFQSTPSAWRETARKFRRKIPSSFQSTPSAWRETLSQADNQRKRRISIHSLRMEGDISGTIDWDGDETFQSTPSAWRETSISSHLIPSSSISIHSLRMEGDGPSL